MSERHLDMGLRPAEPLWQRAPSRDAEGRPLSDFMMLIPRLSQASDLHRKRVYADLATLCRRHARQLHFVNLNLRLNLLWVSVDAAPGVIPQLVAAIRERIPEALLIGHEGGFLEAPARRYATVSLLARWFATLKARIPRRAGRCRGLFPPDIAPR